MTITSLEPLVLPMPEPEDEVDDVYHGLFISRS